MSRFVVRFEFTTQHGKLYDSLYACANGKPLAGAMMKKKMNEIMTSIDVFI
jgi:hypothetical protein